MVRRPKLGKRAKIYRPSIIMPGATLGMDVVVGAFCFIGSGANVGNGTRIQSHTSVWDGVVLGEDVFVGPGAMFTNVKHPRAAWSRAPNWDLTRVGDGATIGAHATLIAPLNVGRFAMIGAGAVVTKDVPDHAIVAGNPARILGWACECGETASRALRRPKRVLCKRCATSPRGRRSRSP